MSLKRPYDWRKLALRASLSIWLPFRRRQAMQRLALQWREQDRWERQDWVTW